MEKLKIKVINIGLFLMFILVLFPSNIKPLVIISFSLIIVLSNIKNSEAKFNKEYFFLNAILFVLISISISYSEDLKDALRKVETMFSLFLFPLLFSFFSESGLTLMFSKKIETYLFSFILSVIVINIGFFLFFWLGEFTFSDTLRHYTYLIDNKLGDYNIHPIYMSMHICVAIMFCVFLITTRSSRKIIVPSVLMVLLLAPFLLLLSKKGPIISLALILTGYVLLKTKLKNKLLFVFSIIIFFSILFNNQTSRNHFFEILSVKDIREGEATSSNMRYTIYKCGLNIFKKEPFLGYGIGDANNELKEKYKEVSPILFESKYNSHNQYLSFLLQIGLIGLIVVLGSYFILFKKGLKSRNYLFLMIFCFYLIEMLTENILERQDGVIFYSFFVGLLQVYKKNTRDKDYYEG